MQVRLLHKLLQKFHNRSGNVYEDMYNECGTNTLPRKRENFKKCLSEKAVPIRVNGLTEGIQCHSKERFGGILNCNWCDYRRYIYCAALRFHSRCERGLSISGTSGPYERKTGWYLVSEWLFLGNMNCRVGKMVGFISDRAKSPVYTTRTNQCSKFEDDSRNGQWC